MTVWTSDELDKIGRADELQIQSSRQDGSLRKPVTIWVVRLGDDLYVRSVKGRESWWFRGTQDQGKGRILAGGVEKDVTFVEPDESFNADLDAAYRSKYGHYDARFVDPMVAPPAQSAALRLVPR